MHSCFSKVAKASRLLIPLTVVLAGALVACGGASSDKLTAGQDAGKAAPEPSQFDQIRLYFDTYASTPAVQSFEVEPVKSLSGLTKPNGQVLVGIIVGVGDDVTTPYALSGQDGVPAFSNRFMTMKVKVDRAVGETASGEIVNLVVPVWFGGSDDSDRAGQQLLTKVKAVVPVGAPILAVTNAFDGRLNGYAPTHAQGTIFLHDNEEWLTDLPTLEEAARGLDDAQLLDRILGRTQTADGKSEPSQFSPAGPTTSIPPTSGDAPVTFSPGG